MEQRIRLTLTQTAALTTDKAIGCVAGGWSRVQWHQYFIHIQVAVVCNENQLESVFSLLLKSITSFIKQII